MPQKKSEWDKLKAQNDQTFVKRQKENSESNKRATNKIVTNIEEAEYTREGRDSYEQSVGKDTYNNKMKVKSRDRYDSSFEHEGDRKRK